MILGQKESLHILLVTVGTFEVAIRLAIKA